MSTTFSNQVWASPGIQYISATEASLDTRLTAAELQITLLEANFSTPTQTISTTWSSGDFTSVASTNIIADKIKDVVTVTINQFQEVIPGGKVPTLVFQADQSLTASYRPTNEIFMFAPVTIDNGVNFSGLVRISTLGVVQVQKNLAGPIWTAGMNNGWVSSFSISFIQ